jgi:hypothetical protein
MYECTKKLIKVSKGILKIIIFMNQTRPFMFIDFREETLNLCSVALLICIDL